MDIILTVVLSFILSGNAAADIDYSSLPYVGCFDLSYSLSNNYHNHLPDISFERCYQECSEGVNGPTRYIGIEISDNFCYCGDDIAEESNKKDDNECGTICSEGSNQTCGGDWLMSLYQRLDVHPPVAKDPVSFLVGISAGVRVYNTSNLPQFDTVMVTNDNAWAYTVDYHFALNLVFAKTRGKLVRMFVTPTFQSKTPRSNWPTTILSATSLCDGFTVDWVLDKIFYAICKNKPPAIMSMNLDGTAEVSVSQLGGITRGIKRMEVDPYARMLFWLSDNSIETLNMTEMPTHRTNVSGEGVVVRAMALDITTRKVYYVAFVEQLSPLYSMDYAGNSHVKVFRVPEMHSVFGLGLHGKHVYWVNYARSVDLVYGAPLMGNGLNVSVIQTIDKAVWHMKVIHADIQKPPNVRSLCSSKGCSHFCEEVNSTTVVCKCPVGSVLNGDELTCMREDTESTVFTTTTGRVPTTTVVPTPIHEISFANATYIGCYSISNYGDSGIPYMTMLGLTFERCINSCIRQKKPFVGISVSEQAYTCQYSIGQSYSRNDDDMCPDQCPMLSYTEVTCGGEMSMSMYDISAMLPDWDHGDSVLFLMGQKDAARLYNSSNMSQPNVLFRHKRYEHAFHSVDYHYSKNLVFISSGDSLSITHLFASNETYKPRLELPDDQGRQHLSIPFAVDWVFDRIFWMDCSVNEYSLKSINLEGDNFTTLWKIRGFLHVRSMDIDPYYGLLFWLTGDAIMSCETTGGNVTTISSSKMKVLGITLDIHEQRLYYMGQEVRDELSGQLISTDYTGNDVKIYGQQMDIGLVYGLGVVRGYAYWVNYHSLDVLHKVKLSTTSGKVSPKTTVVKAFGQNFSVWSMKVVDPELQRAPDCSVNGKTSCAGRILARKAEVSKVHIVLLSTFAVAVLVLITVLVLLLTDAKEVLRSLLIRTPYVRERGADTDGLSPIYDTQGDSVNLI